MAGKGETWPEEEAEAQLESDTDLARVAGGALDAVKEGQDVSDDCCTIAEGVLSLDCVLSN